MGGLQYIQYIILCTRVKIEYFERERALVTDYRTTYDRVRYVIEIDIYKGSAYADAIHLRSQEEVSRTAGLMRDFIGYVMWKSWFGIESILFYYTSDIDPEFELQALYSHI